MIITVMSQVETSHFSVFCQNNVVKCKTTRFKNIPLCIEKWPNFVAPLHIKCNLDTIRAVSLPALKWIAIESPIAKRQILQFNAIMVELEKKCNN